MRLQEWIVKSFTFFYYVMLAVVVSFFPLYYDSLGFSKTQIGTLYSIGPMMAIASNLIWGLLSDRWQTLKKTILLVLFGQLAAILLLFQTKVYSTLFVIMAVFYFFQTPLSGLNDSNILLHVRQTGKSYASYRIWGSIGYAVAAVVFGMILSRFGLELVAPLTIASLVIALLLAFLLKDSRAGMKKMEFSGVFQKVLSRKLVWFLLLVLTMSISHRINDGFLSLYMRELGASQDLIGLASMVSAFSEVPIFFLLSKYGHKFRELPLLAAASFFYAIRFTLMSLVSSPVAVIALQGLHSISFGIYFVTALRYMQDLVPDEYRATGQAVFNMVWSGLAGLTGGVVGGRIFDLWGGPMLYRFAAISAAVAMIGFLLTYWFEHDPLPWRIRWKRRTRTVRQAKKQPRHLG